MRNSLQIDDIFVRVRLCVLYQHVYIRIDRNVECSEVQLFVSKLRRHQQREAEELLPWWITNLSVPRL